MKTITVNISFRKDLLEAIDAAAKHESRSRSELIREAARYYLDVKNHSGSVYETEVRSSGTPSGIAERQTGYEAKNRACSYADYLTWPREERWEIIDGVPYDISPAPSRRHQEISMALSGEFYSYLKGKPCRVYAAPFDVRLPGEGGREDRNIKTVIQPDLAVVCRRERLDNRGCIGAPDLVAEILSPHTSSRDSVIKYKLYEREGVREYWLVRPEEQTVAVFRLGSDKRFGRPDMYSAEDKIKVGIFDSLVIDLKDVFGSSQ